MLHAIITTHGFIIAVILNISMVLLEKKLTVNSVDRISQCGG
jgi:hypothetical protein